MTIFLLKENLQTFHSQETHYDGEKYVLQIESYVLSCIKSLAFPGKQKRHCMTVSA